MFNLLPFRIKRISYSLSMNMSEFHGVVALVAWAAWLYISLVSGQGCYSNMLVARINGARFS